MRHLILMLFIVGITIVPGFSQGPTLRLTLPEVIDLATEQSIDAFRNKNMYLARYWEFRYYKAERLPGLSLSSSPVDFNRYSRKEYNFETNQDEYRMREYFNSDVSLSLVQNVAQTGGQIFLRSGLGMVKNLGDDGSTSYTATPISIGYSQELNGYNALKWKAKIEPLKYEKARKQLIESNETLKQKAVSVFFNLARAQIQKSIAETNHANADTLYKVGQGRYQVGTVTQDELLKLELSLLNASQALNQANVNVKRLQSSFNSFLALEKETTVECVMPDIIPDFKVEAGDAISFAVENNPAIIDHEQRVLEADQAVASAKSETGLNTSVFALYGLNQDSKDFADVYGKQNKSQRLNLGVNIPIVDWGRRKGRFEMAKSNREVSLAVIRQERIDFEQEVYQRVLEFNLQSSQVYNAAKADTVAQMGYNVTFQRFLIGKIDVVVLNIASTDQENARMQYVDALNQFWTKYYQLRSLTLFDFEKKKQLVAEYDKILQKQ
ncbi:MAG: TolC family protein [Draconibacterium sp.]